MSRQVIQIRSNPELNIAVDYLQKVCNYNISDKIRQFLFELYETEKDTYGTPVLNKDFITG